MRNLKVLFVQIFIKSQPQSRQNYNSFFKMNFKRIFGQFLVIFQISLGRFWILDDLVNFKRILDQFLVNFKWILDQFSVIFWSFLDYILVSFKSNFEID